LRADTLTARFARGGLGSFLVAGFAALLAVGLQVFIARLLGVSEFGVYAYSLNLVNFLAMVGVLGFETSSLRFVASYRAASDWPRYNGYLQRTTVITAAWSLVLAGGLGAGILLGMTGRGGGLEAVLLIALPLLPILATLKNVSAQLQGLQKVVIGQGVQGVLRPILLSLLLVAAVSLFKMKASALTTMAINVVVTLACLAVALSILRRSSPSAALGAGHRYETRAWVKVSLPLFLISISQTLLNSTDILLLGIMVGTSATGIYAVASQLATAVGFTIFAANGIVAPMIAETYAQQKPQDLERLIRISSRSVLAVATPVLLLLLIFGKEALRAFGPSFVVGWHALALLALGQYSIVMFGSVGFLMTMTGREREASFVIVLCAVLNVALNLLLIPRYGLEGAAAATMIATFARGLILSARVRSVMNVSPGLFSLTRRTLGES
jgi:O-antigen/teichoic acid export membrane protein